MKAVINSKAIKQKEMVKAVIFSAIALAYVLYTIGYEFGLTMFKLSINF